MGGSLNLEILRGGGLKQFWKSRWKGGSKNHAFHRGGVDFLWNNPIATGLVDFAIGLVNSVCNLPDGRVNSLMKFTLKKDGNQSCSSKIFLGVT